MQSWLGLVHQVSHYNQLTSLITPFKLLPSPKTKFNFNDELNGIFYKSKEAVVAAIAKRITFFDLVKPTCLQPDWSTTSIGFFFRKSIALATSMSQGFVRLDGISFWLVLVFFRSK